MTATSAALVLAWIAIVCLTLVLGGVVIELRRARAIGGPPGSRADDVDHTVRSRALPSDPAVAPSRVLLLVDENCAVCHEAIPQFLRLCDQLDGQIEADLLVSHDWLSPDGPANVVIDRDLYAHLFPGWLPALVHATSDGVLSIEPAGSAAALGALIDEVAATAPTPGRR
ncbi:hypothetical protein [Pimelobacter simplex]|uniref:hypothetical protein n=1 Tax=Nocardioides simplex TaxID=2045 RepID=UPI0021503082|nr:hypothetical protein [Pimelobacter simplex]UUW91329.1 hypothetical protein M0M43_07515 [Pimelobacter simplex]UUW95157.1 hypothetical protein M0M48_26020 [Pimelobacter simplex]